MPSLKTDKKVGLLGGTFDPVHNGHLAVAEYVQRLLALDTILFIPAASPPHKAVHDDGRPISSFQDRAAMLETALASFNEFAVSHIESERAAPSYSVDTLRELRQRADSRIRFYFLLGADAFAEIDTWKQYNRLTDYADLVIITRQTNDPAVVADTIRTYFPDFQFLSRENAWSSTGHPGSLIQLNMEPVPISSTLVREKAGKGGDLSGLVPPTVALYIREHELYRAV